MRLSQRILLSRYNTTTEIFQWQRCRRGIWKIYAGKLYMKSFIHSLINSFIHSFNCVLFGRFVGLFHNTSKWIIFFYLFFIAITRAPLNYYSYVHNILRDSMAIFFIVYIFTQYGRVLSCQSRIFYYIHILILKKIIWFQYFLC